MKTAMQLHIIDLNKMIEIVKSQNVDDDIKHIITETLLGAVENAEFHRIKEESHITEAIKADRERVAKNAKTKYVRYDDPKANFHGEDVVDKESILNLPIELK